VEEASGGGGRSSRSWWLDRGALRVAAQVEALREAHPTDSRSDATLLQPGRGPLSPARCELAAARVTDPPLGWLHDAQRRRLRVRGVGAPGPGASARSRVTFRGVPEALGACPSNTGDRHGWRQRARRVRRVWLPAVAVMARRPAARSVRASPECAEGTLDGGGRRAVVAD